jgi:hypothetical protein
MQCRLDTLSSLSVIEHIAGTSLTPVKERDRARIEYQSVVS